MPPLPTTICPAIYPPQAREISELRAQLGMPRGAAAKARQPSHPNPHHSPLNLHTYPIILTPTPHPNP